MRAINFSFCWASSWQLLRSITSVSTPRGSDLVLVGTVDANQIVVSPQIQGRISKLLVDEGTPVKQGDLIAVLDPSELEAEERAAAAMIASMRSQVSANEYTQRSTKGSTTSDVANAQAQLQSSRAQLAQAEATLTRVESDSRRTIGLAAAGVASEQEKSTGRNEFEGAASERRFTEAAGEGSTGYFGFGGGTYQSGDGGREHGGIDSRTDGKRRCAAQGSRGTSGVHEDLRASDGNGAGTGGARGRGRECGAGDRDVGGFYRHMGASGDSGDGRGSHWIRRHLEDTASRRNGSAGKSVL